MLYRILLACLVVGSSALSLGAGATRRDAIAGAFGAASAAAVALSAPGAAHAVSARTGLSSVFTGEYDDPNHPGCLRSIKVIGGKVGTDGRVSKTTAVVKGVDGTGPKGACSEKPELKDVWSLDGRVSKNDEGDDMLFVDFRPKGGPANLLGRWDTLGGAPGVAFPDGNKWTKVAS